MAEESRVAPADAGDDERDDRPQSDRDARDDRGGAALPDDADPSETARPDDPDDPARPDGPPRPDDHLRDLEPGAGCAEIWEHLSERREE